MAKRILLLADLLKAKTLGNSPTPLPDAIMDVSERSQRIRRYNLSICCQVRISWCTCRTLPTDFLLKRRHGSIWDIIPDCSDPVQSETCTIVEPDRAQSRHSGCGRQLTMASDVNLLNHDSSELQSLVHSD